MQSRKVRTDTCGKRLDGLWLSKECFFHSLFVPTFWQRPRDLGRLGFFQIFMNGALADGTSTGDGPLPQPELKAKAEHFLDLAHGQSPGRHSVSPVSQIGETACLL